MLKWTGDWSGVSSLFLALEYEGRDVFHPWNLGHAVSSQPWPYYMSDPRENVKIDIRSDIRLTLFCNFARNRIFCFGTVITFYRKHHRNSNKTLTWQNCGSGTHWHRYKGIKWHLSTWCFLWTLVDFKRIQGKWILVGKEKNFSNKIGLFFFLYCIFYISH